MKVAVLFSLIILFANCSDYSEVLKEDLMSYKALTTHNIDTDIPVINIEVDQDEFDHMYKYYKDEIYVHGLFDLYREGDLVFENLDVRLQVKGAYSAAYPLKSLGLRFDKMYCNADRKLINPINTLPFHNIDSLEILRLRNSGNDFYWTMIKDISYTQVAIDAGLDVDLMYTEQAVVFINDSFLGVMNLRTEGNTRGMANLYGVEKDRVTLAKVASGGVIEIKDGDYERIDNLLTAIKNNNINYLKSKIDIDNFIDYMVFQSFVANMDWHDNNIRFYSIDNEKFRFVVYDLDISNIIRVDYTPVDIINYKPDNYISYLFNIFYSEKYFREKFYKRYAELLQSDLLSHKLFSDITGYHATNIEKLIPYQIQKYQAPETMIEWYKEVEVLNIKYQKREEYVKKELKLSN